MTTITEDLRGPGDTVPDPRPKVTYRLVGDDEAYVESDTLIGERKVPVGADGTYSITLERNDEIEPAGTRWQRTISIKGVSASVVYLNVDQDGTFRVDEVLSEPPAAVISPSVAQSVADQIAEDVAENPIFAETYAPISVVDDSAENTAAVGSLDTRLSIVEAGGNLLAGGAYLPGQSPGAPPTPRQLWVTALGAGTANWYAVGDSVTEGSVSISALDEAWPRVGADLLRADFQPVGIDPGEGYVKAYNASLDTWTRAGGSLVVASGLGLASWRMNASGATLSRSFTGTEVTLYYQRWSSGGTINVKIDGSLVEALSTYGTISYGQSVTYDGLSSGSHTLLIEYVSGNNIIQGIWPYVEDAATGIRSADAARGSHSAFDFGRFNYAWGTPLAIQEPHMVSVMLGLNDRNQERTPTQFETDLAIVIANIRTYAPDAWIVLCNSWQATTTHDYPWDDYEDVILAAVAADTSLGYHDFRALMGDVASPTDPDWFHDNTHPSVEGHAQMAQDFVDYVTIGA